MLTVIGLVSAILTILFQTELFWTLFPAVGYTDGASAAFFLMPFRIWEFAIGAVLAEPFVRQRKVASGLKLFGLVLLVGSYMASEYLDQYPALIGSAIACAGAALVIHTADSGVTAAMMSWRPIVYIGRISYSVYLVHWPLIVLYKWAIQSELSPNATALLFVMSIALGAALHHLIEQPLRHGSKVTHHFSNLPAHRMPAGPALIGVLLISAASSSALAHYLIGALPASIQLPSRADLAAMANKKYHFDARRCDIDSYLAARPGKGCVYGNTFDVLTIGNSHEPHGYGLMRNLLPQEIDGSKVNVVFGGTHARVTEDKDEDLHCNFNNLKAPPLKSMNPKCSGLAEYLNDRKAAKSFDALVVAAYRPMDWGRIYLELALRMQQDNPKLKVIVVGSFYGLEERFRCSDLIEQRGDLTACANTSMVRYYNPNEEREIRQQWPKLSFQYVDQRAAMCSGTDFKTCTTTVDGIPLFYDAHHFHALGTAAMVERLRNGGAAEALQLGMTTAPGPARGDLPNN